MVSVQALYIYPVKSCGGVALDSAVVTPQGLGLWQKKSGVALPLDRQWCVCDEDGFVQDIRVQPKMATVTVELVEGSSHIRLSEPGVSSLTLPVTEDWYTGSEHPEVIVSDRHKSMWFGRPLTGRCAGAEAETWITNFIHSHNSIARSEKFRIVRFMSGTAGTGEVPQRQLSKSFKGKSIIAKRAKTNDTAAFADCAPYHLVSSSSLEDLSRRTAENSSLELPLATARFRPNIVISGMAPYAEDDCWVLKIAGCQFRQLGPTGRCVIPTTDPQTGIRNEDEQPRATLMEYRPRPYGDGAHGGPTFGIWLVPDDVGVEIAINSEVLKPLTSQL
mmetsp:Transcript_16133/g.31567  ORF Transcript_16133/g.31567 Transcript_16133/m.31567 type:complete len:332 (+) Transcript_16133:2-997(+)